MSIGEETGRLRGLFSSQGYRDYKKPTEMIIKEQALTDEDGSCWQNSYNCTTHTIIQERLISVGSPKTLDGRY